MAIVLFVVFLIISFSVQGRLRSKFKKYSQVPVNSGLSGAEVARQMLRDHGIYDVEVKSVPGELTDHYHPTHKVINLSEAVYHGRSVAAAAVAAHETGHAVQHATAYSWLEFRTTMVPLQNASARILNILIMVMIFGGMFIGGIAYQPLMLVFLGAYFIITMFSLVTLPVEFDASKRGLAWINAKGIVQNNESGMAKDALKWAAMTYVVAALGSLVTFLYYLMSFLGADD